MNLDLNELTGGDVLSSTGRSFKAEPIGVEAFNPEFVKAVEKAVDDAVTQYQAGEVAAGRPEPSKLEALKVVTKYTTKEGKVSYGINVVLPALKIFKVEVDMRPVWVKLPIK